MSTIDLVMPKMGESIMEATILKWHKRPGDQVKMDETVLEIATDKVDSEVPSTAEGVVSEVLFNVNDVVPIGAVIARIRTGAQSEEGKGQERRNRRELEETYRKERRKVKTKESQRKEESDKHKERKRRGTNRKNGRKSKNWVGEKEKVINGKEGIEGIDDNRNM